MSLVASNFAFCFFRRLAFSALVFGSLALPVYGQNNGDNNGGQNNAAQSLRGAAGIEVDAAGVLRFRQVDAQAAALRAQAAQAALPSDLAKPSKLRKVSLTRLEKLLAERLAAGESITPDMANLAGLTAINFVFFYPDSGDIVIAGPAEGFAESITGEMVGVETGRPVVQLEDLAVALRAFPPTGEKTKVIGVSIDPTKEGLERMQSFLNSLNGRPITPNDAYTIGEGLRRTLGLQTVSIKGIAPSTHFARVMVEADYRMKLIGIGLERPAAPIKSFAERSAGKKVGALQRWYFVPDYSSVRVSEDQLALWLDGPGVKLVGAEEMVGRDGSRTDKAGKTNKASQQFTEDFTKHYGLMAERTPVYAQLRNLINLSIAAAFIQDRDFYSQANWNLGVLAEESRVATEKYTAPQQVESAVNAYFRNGVLTTPIGGGINIQARQALSSENKHVDDSGKIDGTRAEIKVDGLAKNQWWWD